MDFKQLRLPQLRVNNFFLPEVNKCLTANGGCSDIYTNTEDFYTSACLCPNGHILTGDQHTCAVCCGQTEILLVIIGWIGFRPVRTHYDLKSLMNLASIELSFRQVCMMDDSHSGKLLAQYCHLSIPLAKNYTLSALRLLSSTLDPSTAQIARGSK